MEANIILKWNTTETSFLNSGIIKPPIIIPTAS